MNISSTMPGSLPQSSATPKKSTTVQGPLLVTQMGANTIYESLARLRGEHAAKGEAKSLYEQAGSQVGGALDTAGDVYQRSLDALGKGTEGSDKIRGYGDRMAELEGQLAPLGERLAGESASMFDQSRPWMQQANDIMGLNTGAGGIAGEFANLYRKLTPDSLVAYAASQAQKTVQNSRDQMARALSRTGVSPGSPAFAAALTNAKKYEDALVSSVKNKAHLMGLDKMSDALAQGLQMAVSAAGVSTSMAAQGAQMAGQAADIGKARGDILQGAAGLEATATQIDNTGLDALLRAGSNLGSTQMAAADYYSTQGSSLLSAVQSGLGKLVGSLFDDNAGSFDDYLAGRVTG